MKFGLGLNLLCIGLLCFSFSFIFLFWLRVLAVADTSHHIMSVNVQLPMSCLIVCDYDVDVVTRRAWINVLIPSVLNFASYWSSFRRLWSQTNHDLNFGN